MWTLDSSGPSTHCGTQAQRACHPRDEDVIDADSVSDLPAPRGHVVVSDPDAKLRIVLGVICDTSIADSQVHHLPDESPNSAKLSRCARRHESQYREACLSCTCETTWQALPAHRPSKCHTRLRH